MEYGTVMKALFRIDNLVDSRLDVIPVKLVDMKHQPVNDLSGIGPYKIRDITRFKNLQKKLSEDIPESLFMVIRPTSITIYCKNVPTVIWFK